MSMCRRMYVQRIVGETPTEQLERKENTIKVSLHAYSDISLGSSSDSGTRRGDQEVARRDSTIRSSCALQLGRIDTYEGTVGPGT